MRAALIVGGLTVLVASVVHAPPSAQAVAAAPQPPDLEALYATVESGVLSVVTSTCGASASGSAFLISPTEAVTAGHVVDGSVSLAVVDEEATTVGATVEGFDPSRDVALIRLERPVEGYNFT